MFVIEYIRVPISFIWKPEIGLHNNIDGNYIAKSATDFKATIYSDGTVIYTHIGIYNSH